MDELWKIGIEVHLTAFENAVNLGATFAFANCHAFVVVEKGVSALLKFLPSMDVFVQKQLHELAARDFVHDLLSEHSHSEPTGHAREELFFSKRSDLLTRNVSLVAVIESIKISAALGRQ